MFLKKKTKKKIEKSNLKKNTKPLLSNSNYKFKDIREKEKNINKHGSKMLQCNGEQSRWKTYTNYMPVSKFLQKPDIYPETI